MMERDCNTCKHHVQGRSLDDAPPKCWDCTGHKAMSGGVMLPYWEPEAPLADKLKGLLKEPQRVCATEVLEKSKENPLDVQVGGSHYKDFPIQPIEFAMANGLNACQFNALKYVCRKKGDLAKKLEDLDKAIHVIGIYKKMLIDGLVS